MANFITPEIYASKTSTTNAVLTPQVYASKTQTEHTVLTPQVYASGIWRYNVELNADTEITVTQPWRYENPGYREKTTRFGYTITATAEQSSTGVGFYQTLRTPCFPAEVTGQELWIKCDIWHNGSNNNRWKVYWGNGDGVCLQTDGKVNIFALATQKTVSDGITTSGKHTLLAHFVAGASGLIEYWWDGVKAGEYSGATDTADMNTLYFQSDNANNLFSNIIISNDQIGFDEDVTPVANQWLQPIMTSNGTWEVSDFAIGGNVGTYAKDAFKSNDTSDWANALTAGKYFDLFFKKKVNINKIHFWGNGYLPTAIKLYQSDDGEIWTAQEDMVYANSNFGDLTRTENSYHNYYRLAINGKAANGNDGRLYNINIDALVGAEETPFDEDYDTSRTIVKSEPFDEPFDTRRTLTGTEPFIEYFDTSRRLYETFPFDELFDTVRNAVNYFATKGDTRRTVTATINEKFDTSRSVILPFNSPFDTKRNLAETFSVLFDTQRNIDAGFSEKFDTQRNMTFLFNESFDTKRKLPIDVTDAQSAGVQAIEISMSEKQISDTISVTFAGNTPEIGTPLKGTFYDYDYSVIIEETSTVKGICNASCCTDIDEVIYKMISYNNQYKTAQDHAQRIAAAIGKNLVWQSRNYISTIDEEVKDTNYQSILSNLFGWTDQVPTWLINAFIRGDNLYVIQRGYEENSVDITNLPHTDVTVNRQILRTTYNSESTSTDSKKTFISPSTGYIELIWKEPAAEEEAAGDDKNEVFEYGGIEKFSGTLRFGDTVATYVQGNCTDFENSKNRITTSYDDNDMVLWTSNENKETGEIVTTTYSYASDGICTEEYTVTSQLDDDGTEEVISVREVIHVQLTAGFIGTATYVDGEFQGSTISKGGASAINDYTQTQSSLALGGRGISDDALDDALPREQEQSAQWPTKLNSINGSFIDQNDVPVADLYTLYHLSKELENLNRSIQETISCEVYGYTHIIGYNDKIVYDGKEYFLVSNSVTKDSRIDLRQSITAIRWEVRG